MEGAVVACRGARAAEERLVGEVVALVEAAARTPGGLLRPVRVLVPSASLREHLCARLVRDRPALLGVEVTTLAACARSLAARRPGPARRGEPLLPVLARRAAREEPELQRELRDPGGRGGVLVGVVRDLLDAGFEPAHEEGVCDRLSQLATGRPRERALALVRVARRVFVACEQGGLVPRAALYRAAREVLEEEGEAALPSTAVRIHGVADATGVVSDLIAALVRELGARVTLPLPDDPAFPGAPAPGHRFTDRLLERLGEPAPADPASGAEPAAADSDAEPPRLVLQRAQGASAEARATALELRARLDAGAVPERLGIVARDLGGYRLALSRELRAFGIPFSGGQGFATRETRRVRALLALLTEGGECTADRWLDAADAFRGGHLADLRLGLHGLGIGRLRDVAALDLEARLGAASGLRLPAVRGVVDDEEDLLSGAGEVSRPRTPSRLLRRHISRKTLAWAVAAAGAALEWLEGFAKCRALSVHGEALDALLDGPLGWRPTTPGRELVRAARDGLAAELLPHWEFDGEELALLLAGPLEGAGTPGLGGEGGGVQVLSAMEARGRCFDALFLLGLNRDSFPRPVVEDPLLPDGLRRGLLPLLPDLPVKGRGFDEERHLFAWLCSAAPEVVLSWQAVSDDGKERPRSPLVERVLLARPELPVREALAPVEAEAALRPLGEQVQRAGLHGGPRAQAALLGALDRERGATRMAVQAELEGRGPARQEPGPYSGFVGADPARLEGLFVTRLERLSWCPWQHFLERHLGLEPVPDAFAALPDTSPALLGNVVHDALEALVERAGAPTRRPLAEGADEAPVDVPWPDDTELDALLLAAAHRAASEEGIVLPAFAHFLARRARPLLVRIGELETRDGVLPGVVGAELEASRPVTGPKGPVELRFRADRVDLREKGLELVDYKTGRPVSDAKRASTREGHLLTQVREGKRLQVAAYAAPGGATAARVGRFVFGRPGLEDDHALVRVEAEDAAARAAFDDAAGILLRALAAGALPPRLLNPQLTEENNACEHCELAEACGRGDSGARRRFAAWIRGRGGSDAVRAARDAFDLRTGGA